MRAACRATRLPAHAHARASKCERPRARAQTDEERKELVLKKLEKKGFAKDKINF